MGWKFNRWANFVKLPQNYELTAFLFFPHLFPWLSFCRCLLVILNPKSLKVSNGGLTTDS